MYNAIYKQNVHDVNKNKNIYIKSMKLNKLADQPNILIILIIIIMIILLKYLITPVKMVKFISLVMF